VGVLFVCVCVIYIHTEREAHKLTPTLSLLYTCVGHPLWSRHELKEQAALAGQGGSLPALLPSLTNNGSSNHSDRRESDGVKPKGRVSISGSHGSPQSSCTNPLIIQNGSQELKSSETDGQPQVRARLLKCPCVGVCMCPPRCSWVLDACLVHTIISPDKRPHRHTRMSSQVCPMCVRVSSQCVQ